MFRKDEYPTEEEQKRKAVLSHRLFWLLIILDIILVLYLVVQVALILN